MTEAVHELLDGGKDWIKSVEKAMKEVDAKHKTETRVKLREAVNALCSENRSLNRDSVSRTLSRVFGDGKCIGTRKNGRPCANNAIDRCEGYCRTCYADRPPEPRVITFAGSRVDMSGAGVLVGDTGSGGFPGTPESRSPPPENRLIGIGPLY
tara:strand:+ start:157 stop:615 length:459 start_codon:yes stop_codon:yes gene_type:complete